MSSSEKLSYLVPRNPSINGWGDRVKLKHPVRENVVKLGLDACEESSNDKLNVFLRIKPCSVDFNPYSINNNTLEAEAPSDNAACKKLTKNGGKLINKFQFTTIFSPDSTQETVFQTCVLPNLKRFIAGRNDLLFAYGTSNAGKTFTMQGTVENPGMIPRSIQFIFKCLGNNIKILSSCQPFRYNEFRVLDSEELRKSMIHKNFILNLNISKYQRNPELCMRSYMTGTSSEFSSCGYTNETFQEMEKNLETFTYEVEDNSYSVWISMIEIYNEQIYDLLEVSSERVKLGFAEDENGKVYIKNLRYIQVTNGHEAFQIFEFGRSNLRLGATALNYYSSRSHCICTLTLGRFSDKENSSGITFSRFSFCDLAGVERVKKALAEGSRLIESKSINTSLSIFTKCLGVIRDNQSNGEKRIVPYRESKLTRLFRDAMMGKEAFSIIVNVTPEPHLFNESLNVLKFSAVARQIVPQNVLKKPKREKPVCPSKAVIATANYNIDWDDDDFGEELKDDKSGIELDDVLKYIEKLKSQITEERERADNIESRIKNEYEQKFSKLMDLFDKQRDLFEDEYKRIRGMCDKEKDILMKHYEERERRLKRKRLEDNCPDNVEVENQLEILTRDMELLKSENASLQDLIQQMNTNMNIWKKKYSELQFELSVKERMLSIYKKGVEDGDDGRSEMVKELENELLMSKSKNAKLKELLDENTFDYKDLLVTNTLINEENARLLGDLATTTDAVDDLKRELRDYEKMLSVKTKKIEELEKKLNESSSDIFIESHVEDDKVFDIVDLGDSEGEIGEDEESYQSSESEKCSSESDVEILDVEEWPGGDNQSMTHEKENKSICENNEKNGEITFSRTEVKREKKSLVDCEDLVEQLKKKVDEERERADNIETRIRKELEKEVLELVERQMVNERELFESEKQRMEEGFETKKLVIINCYEEKIKNLTDLCNQQSETIKSLNEALEQPRNPKNEKEFGHNEKLSDDSIPVTEETDRINVIDSEKLPEGKNNKRSMSTFVRNLIKKFESSGFKDVSVDNGEPEDIVQILEEKILKFLETEEANKNEIELLKRENEELKSRVTFKFQLRELSRVEGDETVRVDELTKETKDEEEGLQKENENKETNNGNVICERKFLAPASAVEMSTPDRLSREIEKLSIMNTETKNGKKVSEDKSLHPSQIKRQPRSKKKGKKQKEAECVEPEANEDETSGKNNKGKKCTKKLFVGNDFDDIGYLETSFTEPEMPRLRPRKK